VIQGFRAVTYTYQSAGLAASAGLPACQPAAPSRSRRSDWAFLLHYFIYMRVFLSVICTIAAMSLRHVHTSLATPIRHPRVRRENVTEISCSGQQGRRGKFKGKPWIPILHSEIVRGSYFLLQALYHKKDVFQPRESFR